MKEEINIKKELFLFVGPPGSGKSTKALEMKKEYERNNFKVAYISRDIIRKAAIKDIEIKNPSDYFCKENEVFKTFIKECNKGIKECDVILIDATHISAPSRKKTLSRLNLDNVNINLLVMEIDLDTCLNNNEKRNGIDYVSTKVVQNMYSYLDKHPIDVNECTNLNYKYNNIFFIKSQLKA